MNKRILLLGIIVSVFLTGCVSPNTPSPFTTKNAMRVKTHIHSDMILKMFGEPKSIRVSTCGGKTGKSWQCTEWKYSNYCYNGNCFTFYTSDKDGELYLNHWELNDLR